MVSFEFGQGKQDPGRGSEVGMAEAVLVLGFPLVALLGWALEGWYVGRKAALTAHGRHPRIAQEVRCGRHPGPGALRPGNGFGSAPVTPRH
jgi:hypothetical protein